MSDIIKAQQGLARKAEVNRAHHFEDLYHLLCKREWIEEALQHVLDNDGAGTAGVDGMSWKSFNDVDKSDFENEKFRQHFIETLQKELRMHTFKPMPVRRVEIPKPGTNKKRGLGIPTLKDRTVQTLLKMLMEPIWEADFLYFSNGFRPGRCTMDCVQPLYALCNTTTGYRWVIEGDIKACFDHIDHQALLGKLRTYPAIRRLVKGWLRAGVMEGLDFSPTPAGTPQGGVVSPLLMNIALHGMEERLIAAYTGEKSTPTARQRAPKLIRYADDFVVLHAEEGEVLKAQQLVATWLQGIGLELKPSKTRLSHTLNDYQGNIGFNFLGFSIRQFPVGKTRTGASKGKPLGFKTIITPSKEGVQRPVQALRTILQKSPSLSQEQLIDQLNPVIHGWSLYYRTVVSKKRFTVCDCLLMHMLWQKMTRKHPKKSAKWVKEHYWRTMKGNTWTFATPASATMRTLRRHASTPIQRHIKVKGQASPFDGNLLYWAKRLQHHPLTKTTLGKLLQKQQGKCRWCELLFREEDQIEIDHITPKSEGGGEELSNKLALHRHCHDQRHAKHEAECISHN